jgi:DNA-3-methyladenine glycosylase
VPRQEKFRPDAQGLPGTKLPYDFYYRETSELAQALLGKRLVRVFRGRRRSGIIVETEAYLGAKDPACHTWNGRRTDRVKSMYLDGGHAYVYLIYGMHSCFNVVARRAEQPEAVLIRALDPDPEAFRVPTRTDGPGRLCNALMIDRRLDGESLNGETIFIEYAGITPRAEDIGQAPRVGVEYSGEAALWPLRYFWKGSPHVSRKEKGWKSFPLTRPSGPTT